MIYLTTCRFFQLEGETLITALPLKTGVAIFFVVFVFFCSEIYQVNNYKRRAL